MDGKDALDSFKMPMPVAPPQEKKQDKTMTYVVVALAALGVLAVVAFFVLPVVIGTLFYTGAMNPGEVTPTSCIFPHGITCSSYKLRTDGSLDLAVGQATGHTIVVDMIACSPAGGLAPMDNEWVHAAVEIPTGEQKWISGQTAGVVVKCGTGGDAGDFYKGKIWIRYTETDTGMERAVIGDLAAEYEN